METKKVVALVAFLTIGIVGLMIVVLFLFVGLITPSEVIGERVAVIEVYGPITNTGGVDIFGGIGASADRLIPLIREVKTNNQYKALILKIDTPGGSAAGSQSIYRELMRLKEETDKPIIATMGDSATSGGYYIASAAHHIMANPATLTGSIGVIMEVGNFEGLYEKLGIDFEVFKGGEYKDLGNPNRSITQEESIILQDLTDDIYEQFIAAVAEGRGMDDESVRSLATGEIFSGRKAYQMELVDELGNYYDAIDRASQMAGLDDPYVENLSKVRYGLWYSLLHTLGNLSKDYSLFSFMDTISPLDTIRVLF